MTTVTVMGEGGSVWQEDLAAPGSVRRLVFDGLVAKGQITLVDADAQAERVDSDSAETDGSPDVDPLTVPHASIDDVLAWVHEDPFLRLDLAYEAELNGKNRKGLLSALADIVDDFLSLDGETAEQSIDPIDGAPKVGPVALVDEQSPDALEIPSDPVSHEG